MVSFLKREKRGLELMNFREMESFFWWKQRSDNTNLINGGCSRRILLTVPSKVSEVVSFDRFYWSLWRSKRRSAVCVLRMKLEVH